MKAAKDENRIAREETDLTCHPSDPSCLSSFSLLLRSARPPRHHRLDGDGGITAARADSSIPTSLRSGPPLRHSSSGLDRGRPDRLPADLFTRELAARCPVVGGQYAYLRRRCIRRLLRLWLECCCFVIQTGGMAAVAVTLCPLLLELTQWPLTIRYVAAPSALLTAINCLGYARAAACRRRLR